MSPRLLLTAAAAALLALAPAGGAATAPSGHDFDPTTLAAYVDLRFSSAVPPSVIRQVLAGEGFSQANLALIGASTPAPGRPATDVGPPGLSSVVQISRDPLACPGSDPTPCELDTEAEPHIAGNPANPGNLVGVFQQGRFPNGGAADIGWATSFDGGRTWPYGGSAPGLTVAVSPRPTAGPGIPFARASDPVVAYDRRHKNVYLNGVAVSDPGCAVFCDSAVTVNVSNNQGQTFAPAGVVHEDLFTPAEQPVVFNDKNWIAVDNTPGSPYYGRTYAVWDQVRCFDNGCNVITSQPVVLSISDDGGKTWGPLIAATHEEPAAAHQEVGVQPLVLPNGHVVVVYADVQAGVYTFSGSYEAIRSTDGGRSWSNPALVTVADPFAEEGAGLRAPNVPAAAVDGDGTIYVAFQDQRFGAGRNDILLTSSTDEGQTWSLPVDVTPLEPSLDHFTPAIAVVGGVVHLTYRTHLVGNVEAAPLVDAVYRRIGPGGAVSAPTLLAQSDASVAAFTNVAGTARLAFFGDYAGVAASPTAAHPIWDQAQGFGDATSNPTNTHQRSFSARIQ